jgi:hypothetical protein
MLGCVVNFYKGYLKSTIDFKEDNGYAFEMQGSLEPNTEITNFMESYKDLTKISAMKQTCIKSAAAKKHCS